jgi:hypothetical protein
MSYILASTSLPITMGSIVKTLQVLFMSASKFYCVAHYGYIYARFGITAIDRTYSSRWRSHPSWRLSNFETNSALTSLCKETSADYGNKRPYFSRLEKENKSRIAAQSLWLSLTPTLEPPLQTRLGCAGDK